MQMGKDFESKLSTTWPVGVMRYVHKLTWKNSRLINARLFPILLAQEISFLMSGAICRSYLIW
jgi:hypothetical protein